ncbi:hypothetical protein [Candidatus Odyssella acanthamoebae]|uniref:Leucine Rich repeats (2 copies) n=1 Tax=Candidatus Odyssella acanthamoebae TaxID=91604 RepID=A0A077AZ00_9PROT|nr:hypothetical protein [Candidatus Paracaedibacter acanthamoebae]AIK96858.1 hypothetical protein ID47_09115 [Candidatus Paracaedibacter acanthamoebae]
MKYFILAFCAILRGGDAADPTEWDNNHSFISSPLSHPLDFSHLPSQKQTSTPDVTYVNLAAYELEDKGCVPLLTRLIPHHHTLEHLDLSLNRLGKEAAPHLTTLTDRALKLRYLDLRLNQFSGNSLVPVLKNLERHNKIKYLDLSFNSIDSTGIDALCDLTRIATSLQHLSLDFIGVSKNKRLDLLKSLGKSPSLSHVSLAYNLLAGSGREIGQMIKSGETLTTLGLARCDLTLDDFKHIIQAVNTPLPKSRKSILSTIVQPKTRRITLKLEKTWETELIAAHYAQHKLETPQITLLFHLGPS